MTIFHLLLVIYHRLELPPTRHTTIDGNETHRSCLRNFGRPALLCRRDFLTKIIRPSMKLAIGPLRNKKLKSRKKNTEKILLKCSQNSRKTTKIVLLFVSFRFNYTSYIILNNDQFQFYSFSSSFARSLSNLSQMSVCNFIFTHFAWYNIELFAIIDE